MNYLTRYSQNFLRDPRLVESLLRKTTICPLDTVYDIGGGKGIIAAALAKICRTVVTVEIDPVMAAKLRRNLHDTPNVIVYEADFLQLPLPQTPYKVFANIPFNLSSAIVHKLTESPYSPEVCYLIVQKEFAAKLLSRPGGHHSQLAATLGTGFEARIVQQLRMADFYPRPSITAVLLEITRRPVPLLPDDDLPLYRDFIAYAYNAFKPSVATSLASLFTPAEFARLAPPNATPTQLDLAQWLALFTAAIAKRPQLVQLVGGYAALLDRKHAKRTAIHRTSTGKK